MLTAEGCQQRRKRLFDALADKPDWIVISDPQHLIYFANFMPDPFIFRGQNSAALLFLNADGRSVLVIDNMLRSAAERAHVSETLTATWYDGKKTAPARKQSMMERALEFVREQSGASWGFEQLHSPAAIVLALQEKNGKGLKLTAVDNAIHQMKRRKDSDELDCLRLAISAGDAAHAAIMRDLRPGMTELDAWLIAQRAATTRADRQVWVYGDFAAGPRTEKGGGPASNRKVERGDLVLLDFSVIVNGYRGDFANTFVCGAKPTAEQNRLYQACIAALAAGERAARAGVTGKSIDDAVRQSFRSMHLEENFKSHSGHGLGLGHPDPPYLTRESTDTLLAGDVIAIEPSQLVEGVGGMRYERNYLVRDDGLETLSKLELRIDATK